jgi:hypothetical protein
MIYQLYRNSKREEMFVHGAFLNFHVQANILDVCWELFRDSASKVLRHYRDT